MTGASSAFFLTEGFAAYHFVDGIIGLALIVIVQGAGIVTVALMILCLIRLRGVVEADMPRWN